METERAITSSLNLKYESMRSNLKEKTSSDFCLQEIFAELMERATLELVNKDTLHRKDRSSSKFSKIFSLSKNTNFFVFMLICLQILDGIFTYVGIRVHGTGIEGNPIIQKLISTIGSSNALVAAKLFSVMAILLLWKLRAKVRWVPASLVLLCFYYLFFAILPWSIVLAGI